MAESAAQKRSRVMKERIAAARERAKGGEQEDRAVGKITGSPASTYNETPAQMRTQHYTARRPSEEVVRNQPISKSPTRTVIRKSQQGDARTYQKHVLFAIVSAFLVRLVAGGKFSAK